nr:MAG TPA: hypothetical protein [Caudoviricetes sp.]
MCSFPSYFANFCKSLISFSFWLISRSSISSFIV